MFGVGSWFVWFAIHFFIFVVVYLLIIIYFWWLWFSVRLLFPMILAADVWSSFSMSFVSAFFQISNSVHLGKGFVVFYPFSFCFY